MSLKPRLMTVTGFIRPNDRVADIGTDHARLPVYLIQQKRCAHVIAADVSEGPLERARRTLRIHNLQQVIPLRRSDGLADIAPDEVDTVVMAGMGGDTILSIARSAPWLKDKRLILQPQTRQLRLRVLLEEEGFVFLDEAEVLEGRRTYKVYVFDAIEKRGKDHVES